MNNIHVGAFVKDMVNEIYHKMETYKKMYNRINNVVDNNDDSEFNFSYKTPEKSEYILMKLNSIASLIINTKHDEKKIFIDLGVYTK